MTSGYKLSATSSRSLKFHDESTDPTVQQRYCAVWNPDLNGVGAWDTTGVNSIYSDDTITTCFATTLGTFAVVAQMDEKPYVQVKIKAMCNCFFTLLHLTQNSGSPEFRMTEI